MVRQAYHEPALSSSKGPSPRAAQALAPRACTLPSKGEGIIGEIPNILV